MNNYVISIIAIIILGFIAIKFLATAWVGLKLLPAVALVVLFLGVGWLWGKLTK